MITELQPQSILSTEFYGNPESALMISMPDLRIVQGPEIPLDVYGDISGYFMAKQFASAQAEAVPAHENVLSDLPEIDFFAQDSFAFAENAGQEAQATDLADVWVSVPGPDAGDARDDAWLPLPADDGLQTGFVGGVDDFDF